jgi:hypothetical protein
MTTERREVLRLLGELSDRYPEMRIGQLLTWFAGAARQPGVEAVYDADDRELADVMKQHLDREMINAPATKTVAASA